MATANRVEYHVFATLDEFSKLGLDPLGTTTERRAGIWYAAKLLSPPELGMSITDGVGLQRATEVTLRIADGPDGAYRNAVANGSFLGTSASVTVVMRETDATGFGPEVTETQLLTITAVSLTRSEVILRCSDIEEAKLNTLYPSLLWSPTTWPQLRDTDAGRPVCEPVGTALKFPCPQIVADDARAEYFFGVCTGTPKLMGISGINSTLKRVTLTASYGELIEVGQVVYIANSSAADGRYTVSALISATVFSVWEALPASIGGSVRLMPHVRTLYRAGRVIDPADYSIVHVAAMPTLSNGNFATNSLIGWTVLTLAGGTASAATGQAVLTVSGVASLASISQALTSSKDLWHAVTLDVDAASTLPARVNGAAVDAIRELSGGGRRAALIRATATGANTINIAAAAATGSAIVDNVVMLGTDLVVALFTRPQVDFQGSAYVIEADVRGVESRNAATEVARLLTAVGVTPDPSTVSGAESVATANRMLVDCGYGRAGQRTTRAIVDDHLFLLRGGLYRNALGRYAINQDKAGISSVSLDESLGDSVEVEGVDWASKPASVGIKYRPGARDPGTLQQPITRAVATGTLGDETPREMPYLRDHEAADRLLSYLAARRAYSGRCRATVYRRQFQLGAVLTLASPLNWGAGAREWIVRAVRRVPNANALELMEYNGAVYTYVPSVPLPTDAAGTDYLPDYSQTPPAAPTALTITAADVALAPDGSSSAWVTVRCTPPLVNWAQIWFTAIHNVTGEVAIGQGTDIGGGNYGTTLAGLRAGNVYQLKAYAINQFNVQGALQGTFNATAIGGGAAATLFTTPGYATLPPNVASCTATQGTGLIVQVKWPVVSLPEDILGDYILEKKTNLGAFAEVWRGRANGYTDRDFAQYGLVIQYRVKASDRWGNLSAAYTNSNAVTLARTIWGGTGPGADIRDGTVDSVNRTNVSTISTAFSTPNPQNTYAIVHGLGIIPLVTYDVTARDQYWLSLSDISSANLSVTISQLPNYQDGVPNPGKTGVNDTAGDPHRHPLNVLYATDNSTFKVRIW